MRNSSTLTAERARHVFSYQPIVGKLTWKNPTSTATPAGSAAGSTHSSGYVYVEIDGHRHLVHRLIWLLANGEWPVGNVVAINGDFTDLRLKNFKIETPTETSLRANKKISKSGQRGVYWEPHTSKFRAEIRRHYQIIPLGRYDTIEEAKEAYLKGVRDYVKPDVDPVDLKAYTEKSKLRDRLQSLWKRTAAENPSGTGWPSFEAFSTDLKDHIFPQGRVVAVDPSRPVGPGNFQMERRAKFNRNTPEGRVAYYLYRNERDRDRIKNTTLKNTFGLSLDEFNAMYTAQNGLCAMCGEPETWVRGGRLHSLSVDHCHETGAIRELLCRACNNGIGHFKENTDALRKAADYLDRHDAKNKPASVPASNVIPIKIKER